MSSNRDAETEEYVWISKLAYHPVFVGVNRKCLRLGRGEVPASLQFTHPGPPTPFLRGALEIEHPETPA